MKNLMVKTLLQAIAHDMGGLPILQPFPSTKMDHLDPFLLLHHANVKVPQMIKPAHAGVGPHPHRGFSPVTFVFKGAVHHRDSRGNSSVVYEGGAQWMNAGRGVIHSERPSDDIHKIGGRQEIIQLWINTPAARKMDQPEYFAAHRDQIEPVTSADEKVKMNVFAGELNGRKGPIPTNMSVNAATIEFEKDGTIEITIPADHNSFMYLLDGELEVSEYGDVKGRNAVVFETGGGRVRLIAKENTRALLMSGKPLNEEIVAHGPFVMNSQTEILEAMRDYQMGKMGVLIEDDLS